MDWEGWNRVVRLTRILWYNSQIMPPPTEPDDSVCPDHNEGDDDPTEAVPSSLAPDIGELLQQNTRQQLETGLRSADDEEKLSAPAKYLRRLQKERNSISWPLHLEFSDDDWKDPYYEERLERMDEDREIDRMFNSLLDG